MTKLNFEIGKFYRTRDGRKAQIFMLDNGDGYILGAILIDDIWIKADWKNTGTSVVHGNPELDLVAEWREPRKISTEVWIIPGNQDPNSSLIWPRLGAINGWSSTKISESHVKVRLTLEDIPD